MAIQLPSFPAGIRIPGDTSGRWLHDLWQSIKQDEADISDLQDTVATLSGSATVFLTAGNWSNVLGSRAVSTVYQNTDANPRVVQIGFSSDTTVTGYLAVSSDAVTYIDTAIGYCSSGGAVGYQGTITTTVPAGYYYKLRLSGAGTFTLSLWAELSYSSATHPEWGTITGTLSDQTDLQTALNAKQPLDATLTSLAAFNTNGLLTQTSADTFTGRTITGTSNRLAVSDGNGVSGNPTLDIDAAYVGQTSITTLGTIATGVWHGTQVGEIYGGTNQTTYALGDTLYSSAANTLSKLSGNITTTKKFLRQTGDGVNSAAPAWDTIVAADVPGSALTKTDDTNVTLTLGGAPTTALLNATSLTLGWTGQLSVARGGTGQSTYTDGQLLIGNTTGNTLTKTTLTGTSNQVVVTNGSGSITLSTPQDIATTSTPQFKRIGIGVAPAAAQLLRAAAASGDLTGTTQYGLSFSVTTGSDCSVSGIGINIAVATGAASYTMTNAIGILISDVTQGSGSTITQQFGISIADQTKGSTLTAGIRSLVSSGTGKWNLYLSGTAANYLAGKVQAGNVTATAGAEQLQVNGSLSINDSTLIRTYTAFTNGAGALTGTLTNSPVTGNPTKWIPINDNGTTRYIPAW